jgi:hypothetical protein
MKNNIYKIIASLLLIIFFGCKDVSDNKEMATEESNPSLVQFEDNGYLSASVIDPLKDEQMRVKAVSAYEYALPIVGMEVWHKGFLLEAEHGDWLIYENRLTKTPIITANTTTPYVVTFVDLAESSYYMEIPAGPIGGLINSIYQTPESDLGVVGPDKGKGGKYLVVGPESEMPTNHDADYVVKTTSNLVLMGTRIIGLEAEAYQAALNAHKVYKVSETGDDQKFIQATEDPQWMGNQPHGLAFWKDLNDVLQNEPVVDRNRFILTQLREVGIEKGKAFEPSEHQKEILLAAEKMGNAFAMVNTFSRESYKEKHWPDRNWLYVLNMEHLDQVAPNYYETKEIASYTYEAITTSAGMVLNNVGSGSKYLASYIDESKKWLDGENTYEIVIPKDAPANQFWSITVYDNDTRCIIQNEQGKSDISSAREGVRIEEDGSYKVFVGPTAPEGYENNWVQSNPEKGFFAYLRLYGPLESFYDKSWKMPDVKKVNE